MKGLALQVGRGKIENRRNFRRSVSLVRPETYPDSMKSGSFCEENGRFGPSACINSSFYQAIEKRFARADLLVSRQINVFLCSSIIVTAFPAAQYTSNCSELYRSLLILGLDTIWLLSHSSLFLRIYSNIKLLFNFFCWLTITMLMKIAKKTSFSHEIRFRGCESVVLCYRNKIMWLFWFKSKIQLSVLICAC